MQMFNGFLTIQVSKIHSCAIKLVLISYAEINQRQRRLHVQKGMATEHTGSISFHLKRKMFLFCPYKYTAHFASYCSSQICKVSTVLPVPSSYYFHKVQILRFFKCSAILGNKVPKIDVRMHYTLS